MAASEIISAKRTAFEYLMEHKCGSVSELQISEELFNEFCLVVYIRQGMDGSWNERWHLTEHGEHQISSYIDFFQRTDELLKIGQELSKK